jgi:HlyD family secretion protein
MVEAVAVKSLPMAVSVEEEGRTRVIDRYIVSAPVDGVACRVQLDVGDAVTRGQVLLGITPLESQVLDARSRARAEARVAAAESALSAAREQASAAAADEEFASTELERLRPLLSEGLISRESFDKAQTLAKTSAAASRSASFNVEVASYDLEAARTTLQYSAATTSDAPAERVPVRSPIDGRILKVHHECEGPVGTGEPLFEVGDPSALEVEVDVLSADAVKIKPGMAVLFDRWGGDQPLQGLVRNVEPIGFTEQWQSLGDGYRIEAQFVLWQQDDVLQVPASSLFRYQQGWAVFVIEADRAVRRVVEVGQRNGLSAQILNGLKQGEQVVNHPSDAVEDGVSVKQR